RSERSRRCQPLNKERAGIIVKSSGRGPKGSLAIATDVPCKSETRREIPPLSRHAGCCAGSTNEVRIAIQLKPDRNGCIREPPGFDAPVDKCIVELDCALVLVHQSEEGFPTKAIVQCPARFQLPSVTVVERECLAQFLLFRTRPPFNSRGLAG